MLLAAAAPLAAQQAGCNYSLNQTTFLFAGSSTQPLTGTVQVTTTAACTWSFSTAATWIHFQPVVVTGTGALPFTVDANSGSSVRQASIAFMGGAATGTITVIQMAGTCNYTLSATSIEIPVSGGSGSLQVTTGCSWQSASNETWLTTQPDSGNLNIGTTNIGNGAVDYTVAANLCAASRTASITVVTGLNGTPPALAISEDGSPNNLTLSQTTLTTSSSATTGRITVTTAGGCAWGSVFSDSSWLGITSTTATSGLGSLAYSILANTGSVRTGNIHVGPQTFAVTQQAIPLPPILLTAVVNGADYASGAVSPGEVVALGGNNLGPLQGVPFQLSADGKSIPNALAGVQVLFGNAPATLLYVSAGQINAIVPYAVAGSANTTVQVQYQGQTSNTMTVPVQAATPGIFSQDQSGAGPGAILNQDFSVNASLSPAAVGSVIQIYATGGGVTIPAQTDGVLAPVAPPFPTIPPLEPVSVTIGGFSAQVNYAGAAPGLVAGVTQINAVLPLGVTPGLAVPVLVQIGSWQSQAGLTITVH